MEWEGINIPILITEEKDTEIVSCTKESRCCGRCDGNYDICVADMVCEQHNEIGCEVCYGKRSSGLIINSAALPKAFIDHAETPGFKCRPAMIDLTNNSIKYLDMQHNNLNKENFFNDMMEKYPKAMEKFCAYIDVYKLKNDWEELFNGMYHTMDDEISSIGIMAMRLRS